MAMPARCLSQPWSDSGADVTIVPVGYLRAIGAEEIYSAHLRAHWGGRRVVTIFMVDLEIERSAYAGY